MSETIIHITLEDGRVLLFDADEELVTTNWISDDGEYIGEPKYFVARDFLFENNLRESGYYIIRDGEYGPECQFQSRVVRAVAIPNPQSQIA